MNGAILRSHQDVKRPGSTSGARQWRVMLRIFLPLVTPALVGVWIWSLLHAARITGVPILLYEGTKSQVVAVLMWTKWQQGQLTEVAALGTTLTAFLLIVSVCVRLAGFGKGLERGQTPMINV